MWLDTNQGITITEDGLRLKILDLESRGIVLSMLIKQRRLCFCICRLLVFSLCDPYREILKQDFTISVE